MTHSADPARPVYQGVPLQPAALITHYSMVALYALASSLMGVATLQVVSGDVWEAAWPALLFLASCCAIAGVLRTRRTSQAGFELISSVTLMALLAGYMLALLYRSAQDGDLSHVPIAFLPGVVCVFPSFRAIAIARGVVRR